jgi:hypothetical protein
MTYARDPYDTDEPPCVCGLSGPMRTTEEFCPAHGDPDKPVTEPEGNEDEAAYTERLEPCACPCHDASRSPICMTCCDDR